MSLVEHMNLLHITTCRLGRILMLYHRDHLIPTFTKIDTEQKRGAGHTTHRPPRKAASMAPPTHRKAPSIHAQAETSNTADLHLFIPPSCKHRESLLDCILGPHSAQRTDMPGAYMRKTSAQPT